MNDGRPESLSRPHARLESGAARAARSGPCDQGYPVHRPACLRVLRLLSLLGCALSPGVHAGHEAPSEAAFLGELPMVLSASRLSQPLSEAPGAMTVIDRDMIRLSGARTVAELLRLVPGMQVGSRSGYYPLATYHGLSDDTPRRMLVRIDGRSTYAPYLISGTEWHTITVDLEDVERIEVFRGTNASAYGSQAFMGVVNIVTRAAADSPRLRARFNQGENGIRDRNVSIGQHFGSIAVRLSAGREGDSGIPKLHDSHRRHRADLRVDWQIDPEHRLEFHAGMVRLKAHIGHESDYENPVRPLQHRAAFGQVRWRWQPTPEEELNLTVYQQETSMHDGFRVNVSDVVPLAPPQWYVDVDYDNRIRRSDIELEHIFSPGTGMRLVWGLGYRDDRLRAYQIFHRDLIRYRSGRLFANLEWRATPQWLVNAGIMAERGNYAGTLLAPRLAANYHLSERHTLRASVGRAYRRLTPFEHDADMRFYEANTGILLLQTAQPSPDVRPERITVRELGYRAELAQRSISVDIRLFEERIDRLIRRDNVATNPPPLLDPRAQRFFSDDRATVSGVEVATMWRPTATTWLGVNFTRLNVVSSSDRAERSAPRTSASLLAAWSPAHRWHLSLAHHYVGTMGWYIRESQSVPKQRRTDIRIARSFSTAELRGEFALVLANLGKRDADFRPAFKTPRQSYASLSIEF